MMRSLGKLAALALCALLCLALAPRTAAAASNAYPIEAHIYTHNASDAFVWISVDSTARGGWCVAPRGRNQHSLETIPAEVRAEFFKAACKHGQRLHDQALPFPKTGGFTEYRATNDAAGYHFTGPFRS
jgi:hypothetical protein